MRFRTKVDPWIAACMGVATLVGFFAPLVLLIGSLLLQRQVAWTLAIPVVIWILAVAATIPQYYEFQTEGLFIRQGWRKTLIEYPSVQSAKPVESSLSAGVYSTSRVQIETQKAARF